MKHWFPFFLLLLPLSVCYGIPTEEDCSCSMDEKISDIPLFHSEEVLELTFKTNLKQVMKDKKDERDYHPVELSYVDADGQQVSIEALTRVRGNFRRKMCKLPPLRVKFDSTSVIGTLFEGQDKLKLVTHCKLKGDLHEQLIMVEHLVYRTYRLLTEKSFRVRLAKITYEDLDGKYDPMTRFGFFIEAIDHVANRLGGEEIETSNLHPNRTEAETVDLLSVFEYMIGNTDWSIPGLHNIKIIAIEEQTEPIPVPYDFDWCGAINAPYAIPSESLDIPSVKIRLFRGFCKPKEDFEKVFAIFREKKDEIYSLYQGCPYLSEKKKSEVLKYFDEFYDIINDPRKLKNEIYAKCRTSR
ncbi:MAG: hypothetical protein AAF587_11960 [Bacteroidota bacterium]